MSETTTPDVGRAIERAGPAAEFEEIYRSHVGAVTAFFARRTADPQTVADLTSDTFVGAITGHDNRRGVRSGRPADWSDYVLSRGASCAGRTA